MGFFDFLRRSPASAAGNAAQPIERLLAVPLAARKATPAGAEAKEIYMFYAFMFDTSADQAVGRLRKELSTEGLEFMELTGPVLVTSIDEWPDFVNTRFDWIKDSLPTAAQLRGWNRGVISYSPKITRM